MRLGGWFRLWVVLTVLGVPLAAELQFNQTAKFWDDLNKQIIKTCVDAEYELPTHPDALACGHAQGASQTVFQREGTTPAKYWSTSLAAFFGIDLVITAILVCAALICRWVYRGFRPKAVGA